MQYIIATTKFSEYKKKVGKQVHILTNIANTITD